VIGRHRSRLIACANGSVAVEFAMLLPALAGLIVGGIYVALLVYSAAGLHSAVEQAARCYSVNATQCSSASAAQTYAQGLYYGLNTPTFTASTAACGHQVTAKVTIAFTAVVTDLSVPVSAASCFP
jgi:Flp pilus assembly protein TadG